MLTGLDLNRWLWAQRSLIKSEQADGMLVWPHVNDLHRAIYG